MDNSHYQSAFSTPVKAAVQKCQPSSGEESDGDQDDGSSCASSLASTSLDFSVPNDDPQLLDDDDGDDLQPFFTTAIEEGDSIQSSTSSPTLVEEQLNRVTLNEPQQPPPLLPFASTNPFVDHLCPQVSAPEEEENEDIRSLLSNLRILSSKLIEVESAQKHLTNQISGLCQSAQQINQESARILEKILYKEKVSTGQHSTKVDAQTQTECLDAQNQNEPQTSEPDISSVSTNQKPLGYSFSNPFISHPASTPISKAARPRQGLPRPPTDAHRQGGHPEADHHRHVAHSGAVQDESASRVRRPPGGDPLGHLLPQATLRPAGGRLSPVLRRLHRTATGEAVGNHRPASGAPEAGREVPRVEANGHVIIIVSFSGQQSSGVHRAPPPTSTPPPDNLSQQQTTATARAFESHVILARARLSVVVHRRPRSRHFG